MVLIANDQTSTNAETVEAYLMLQNGSIYKGTAFGGNKEIDGEVGKHQNSIKLNFKNQLKFLLILNI
jgi:hypothetical protein